ncbi:MAG: hypothetical protein R6X09_01735 [Bacteroidales bacterium]
MIRNLTIVTLFLLFSLASVYAQSKWKPGMVIQHKGDTLPGLIEENSLVVHHRYCFFKYDTGKVVRKFTPDQITGYRFTDGNFFVSKPVKFKDEEELMFLQFIVKGKANLYFYRGESDRYFIEKDDQLVELQNSLREVVAGNRKLLQERKEYVGMLSVLMQDAGMYDEIQKTDLGEKSLINITREYHNRICKDEACVIYEKQRIPAEINVGVSFGVYSKKMIIDEFYNYELKNNMNIFGGISIIFHKIPGIYNRLSFQTGIIASGYQMAEESKTAFNLPLLVGYRLSPKIAYPNIQFGLTLSYREKSIDLIPTVGIGLHVEKTSESPELFINLLIENTSFQYSFDNPYIFRLGGGILF